MIDISGFLMNTKLIQAFGVPDWELEKLLPVLLELAIIDKKFGEVSFFKMKKIVYDKTGIDLDEREFGLYQTIRYLYSLVDGLKKEYLILLRKIIDILIEEHK